MPPEQPGRDDPYFYNANSAMPPAPRHFRPASSWWIGLTREGFRDQLAHERLRMQLSVAREQPVRETSA